MPTTQVRRSERFPDLGDELLFPRLSDGKMAWFAKQGEQRTSQPGEVLCEHAVDGQLGWPLSDREPHLLETVRPGVFAAHDVLDG